MKSNGCKTNKKDLNALEKLHCQADGLAKQAQILPRQAKYHNFPNNTVAFTMNKQTINANYPRITAAAYHSIYLRQYMSNKHGWSTPTLDSIWWRIHHQALMKWSTMELMTIQKFNNDSWVTNYRSNKYYTYKPAHCHCCLLT
jgi:hypothetical protein